MAGPIKQSGSKVSAPLEGSRTENASVILTVQAFGLSFSPNSDILNPRICFIVFSCSPGFWFMYRIEFLLGSNELKLAVLQW